MSHQAKNENDVPTSVIFDKHPNTCPICNSKITPQQLGLYVHTQKMELQAPFRCVNKDCMAIFIGYYKRNQGTSNNYSLIDTKPKTFEGKDFSTIKAVMPL